MRPATRYALSLGAGAVAGVASFVTASGAADPTRTWFVTALNVVVWTGAIGLYVPVYERFEGAPAAGGRTSTTTAMKWGGLAGGAASLGISGTGALLVGGYSNWYVGAVCLFVFGLFFLSMSVGMGTVTANLPDSDDSADEADVEPMDD